jgi:hypothetical protein
MATLTLEKPVTAAPSTESQKFRITQINIGEANYGIKYQLADGIEWLKPRTYDLLAFTLQTVTHLQSLAQAVRRVYETEDRWSDANLFIDSLKLSYAGEDDKGDKKNGIEPRPEGALIKVAIASSYQSQFVYGKTHWLSLGSFDQLVDCDRDGDAGFLNGDELHALQEICNNVSLELARQLNKPPAFKPLQLKLL